MHVFVAGATGAIGGKLVRRLIAAGHEVTATTRSAAKADPLGSLGTNPVVVGGLDAETLTKAVAEPRPTRSSTR